MGTNRNYKANRMESVFMQDNIGDWLQEASQRAMSSSKKDRNRGASYSPKEIAEKQYARFETEDERQYQQEFYDRNYSFQGQVNQMQQAGLNPSLMYGQMGSTASSGSSGDTISAPADSANEDSPMAQFDSISGLLSSLLGLGGQAAEVSNSIANGKKDRESKRINDRLNEANIEKTEAETYNLRLEGKSKEISLKYQDAKENLDLKSMGKSIEVMQSEIGKNASQIDVNHSIIELNGSQINLNGSLQSKADCEASLAMSRKLLTDIDAQKGQLMLPYVQAMEEAQIALNEAVAERDRAEAQIKVNQAAGVLLDNAKKQGLLDAGIVAEEMKGIKANRRIAVANCVVGNICNVVNSAVGVANAGSLAVTASANAMNAVTNRGKAVYDIATDALDRGGTFGSTPSSTALVPY